MSTHAGSGSPVLIQISPQSIPSTPPWFGEVTAFAQVLSHVGMLKAIQEQVRFARARFGHYDLIDFVVVLIGYMLSGESTLKAFYERLQPFAEPFMALFGRNQLPHRSTLSRFLAALDQSAVEALRTHFQEDLLVRNPFPSPGGLFDRTGMPWLVIDVDGTRRTARQRALPQTESLPAAHRRFDAVCAPGYLGRKRGEVVRTRTVILQAHTHQFLGTFGGLGNGDYRGELVRTIQVVSSYATKLGFPTACVLLRLDGLYGDAAPLIDVLTAGLGVIARSRDYHLLDLEVVQLALARGADHVSTQQESGVTRALYDCPAVPLMPTGPEVRLVVATHALTSSPPKLASSVMARSTNCLSAHFPPQPLLPRMCWICICIAARLRRCSPMKTSSRSPTGGTLIPHAARSLLRSSRNGSGTSAWNWDKSSPRQSYARPNLPQHRSSSLHVPLSLLPPSSLHTCRSKHLRFNMVLPNGHVLPLPEAFLVLLFFCNRMGRSVAPPTVRCTHKSADLSEMAPFGSCMLLALVIAVPVSCAHVVRKAVPA